MSRGKIVAIVAIVLTPVLAIVGVLGLVFMVMLTAGRGGACTVGNVSAVAAGTLKVQTTSGTELTLDAQQIGNAQKILATARGLGVSNQAMTVAMMTALQESTLYMYANSSVPDSLSFPHDKVGSDHDSVNPFQQRANWGTVAERMDLTYAAKAFFGGPDGPNKGTPRGLLDIDGWESMSPGEAAQTVQVSAFPDAYDKWLPAAQTIVSNLGGTIQCAAGGSGQAVAPLDAPFNMTDDFGPRPDYGIGASTWHPGVDLQNYPNPCGRPVYAVLPGTVTLSSALYLSVKHPDGFVVSYLHMYKSDRLVDVGDVVAAGQQIGLTGNVAPSTGCHLDLRINVLSNTNPQVAQLPQDPAAPGWVSPEDFMRLYGAPLCDDPATCKRQY